MRRCPADAPSGAPVDARQSHGVDADGQPPWATTGALAQRIHGRTSRGLDALPDRSVALSAQFSHAGACESRLRNITCARPRTEAVGLWLRRSAFASAPRQSAGTRARHAWRRTGRRSATAFRSTSVSRKSRRWMPMRSDCSAVECPNVFVYGIGDGYISALGVPLIAGVGTDITRRRRRRQRRREPQACVPALARTHWRGRMAARCAKRQDPARRRSRSPT